MFKKLNVLINGSLADLSVLIEVWDKMTPCLPFCLFWLWKVLENMIKTTNTCGWIKGFELGTNDNNSLEITYLQYIEDTLIFCDANGEQLKHLGWVVPTSY